VQRVTTSMCVQECARPVKQKICRWNPAARVSSQGLLFLALFGNRPEVETCRTQFYSEALESVTQHEVKRRARAWHQDVFILADKHLFIHGSATKDG